MADPTPTTLNLATARGHFATLAQTYLDDLDPKIIKSVFGYIPRELKGVTPCLIVSIGSPDRKANPGEGGKWRTESCLLTVVILVRYYDEGALPAWTEADAYDRYDLIDAFLADFVALNAAAAGYWDDLVYAAPPETPSVQGFDGVDYVVGAQRFTLTLPYSS